MAGKGSSKDKSDGMGYQGQGPKSDYSSTARTSFNTTVDRNQRFNNYTPKGDMKQYVDRTNKGSRLATRGSGTMTSWMGNKAAPKPPTPRAKPVMPAAPKSVRKPTTISIPGGGLKVAKPAVSKPKAMAVNPKTGSTLGFTTGKTTGSTATKSGVAGRSTSATRNAGAPIGSSNKNSVAGPTKNAAGKNASSMTGKRK